MKIARSTDSDVFMTVEGLARRWQKPEQWVYSNWRIAGLTPVRIGRQLRFRRADIEDFERRREAQPG
jgi:hypothetical protein